MKNLIYAIIECDRNASKIIEDAERECERIERSVEDEIESLRKTAYVSADSALEVLAAAEREAGIAKMNEIKERRNEILERFERLYNENGEKWADEITAAVLKI